MAEANVCHDTTKTIKVKGLKQELQKHFQSPKKSNGGDVLSVSLFPDCDKDSVLVEFDDSEVVESVLKREKKTFEIDLELERHSACMTRNPDDEFMTSQKNLNDEPSNNPKKKIRKEKKKIKEMVRNSEKEVPYWDIYNIIRSLFFKNDDKKQEEMDQPQDRRQCNDSNCDDHISIHPLLLRYIYYFHWNEFEELENVCKEMKFSVESTERILHLTAKDGLKAKFKDTLEKFISLYQRLNQEMYQGKISSKSLGDSSKESRISETLKDFSVIVSKCEPDDGYLVFGKKDVVLEAVKFMENGSTVSPSNSRNTQRNESPRKPLSYVISPRTKILVCEGDLTKEVVDVIVNPANQHLRHDGGAAEAIVKSGGKEIQDQSFAIIKQYGKLVPGQVVWTGSGRLPCRFIIHAVGPVWSDQSREQCRQALGRACFTCLEVACKLHEAQTIAIPAISSGLFGMPVNVCAEVLFSAVEHFCHTRKNSEPTMSEIRFLNNKKETVDAFEREMMKRYDSSVTRESGTKRGSQNTATSPTPAAVPRGKQSPKQSNPSQNPGGNQAKMTLAKIAQTQPKVEDKKDKEEKCSICLEDIKNPKVLDKCKHKFCTPCIDESFKHRQVCPICSTVYGKIIGNQPDGTMTQTSRYYRLPGYDRVGTIEIEYNFRSGTQGSNHPNPGQRYYGTSRTAYVPDSKEGKKVVGLLRKAFDQRLTFTIGTSTTTGNSNQVTWNDIHHKTSKYGGPTGFGYPDPEYLRRVQDELKAKGIE